MKQKKLKIISRRKPTDRNMKPILLVYKPSLTVDWNQQVELC